MKLLIEVKEADICFNSISQSKVILEVKDLEGQIIELVFDRELFEKDLLKTIKVMFKS